MSLMPDTVIRLWKKGDDAAKFRNEGVARDEKVEEYKYDTFDRIMGPEGTGSNSGSRRKSTHGEGIPME